MWPYLLMLLLTFWPALKERASGGLPLGEYFIAQPGLAWLLAGYLLALMIGFRYEVGGDWETYLEHIEYAAGEPLSELLASNDPAYALLNWIGANVFGGVYVPNLISAGLFTAGLLRFCRTLPRPWLALSVSLPYLVMVVAMGYTRQSVAIGLSMIGLSALRQNASTWRFVFWIALAATFHKSAVILVPLAVLSDSKHRLLTVLGIAISGILLFVLLLQESVDSLMTNYVEAEYASSGAGIRIAMNALPAFVFILMSRRFKMSAVQKKFWTWMALGAIGFIFLLKISPSSTAVDRVALYWIPLQVFVWAQFPEAVGRANERNTLYVVLVLAYGLVVMSVWLLFAKTAFAWLPYQFFPWVWLWS